MPKPVWVTLSGNVVSADEVLRYTPTLFDSGPNEGKPIIATVRSNTYFQQGTIDFQVKFEDRYSVCTIVLDEFQQIQVSIGGMIPRGPQFSVQKVADNQWQTLATSGSSDLTETNVAIPVRIAVNGSIIELFVRDVRVLYAISQIFRSQLTITFNSAHPVSISDIDIRTTKPKAFVVMQFSKEFDALYTDVISPTCSAVGLEAIRADDIYSTNQMMSDIIRSIQESAVIIADITPDNANVFYEVGFAHGIDKPTILMCEQQRSKLPFDVSGFRTLFYENSIAGKAQVEERLRKHLDAIVGPRPV
jgi:hypothetical protein